MPDAKVRQPVSNVGRRCTRARGDYRDDAGADREANVDAEQQCQRRNDQDPAPNPGERADDPGDHADPEDREVFRARHQPMIA